MSITAAPIPAPTVTEARQVKLEELVPAALLVLERNLKSENENVRQRAAEHVLDRAWGKPVTPTRDETFAPHGGVEQLRELSDRDLEVRLAALAVTEVA